MQSILNDYRNRQKWNSLNKVYVHKNEYKRCLNVVLYIWFFIVALYHFPTYAVQAAVLCGSATAEKSRKAQLYSKDRERTVQPYWLQSKREPSATFRETTTAFRQQKYL